MKNTNPNDFSIKPKHGSIDAINGLLVFKFYDNEFCIDLESFTEVKNVDEVKISIKNSKEAIILLDEQEYKVIQLHNLLGYPELITSSNNRVIFIDMFNKKIAFIVEMINELLTTEFLLLGDMFTMELSPIKKYIKGLIKYNKRKIFIPDFEKISKELNQLTITSGIVHSAKECSRKYNYTKGRNY